MTHPAWNDANYAAGFEHLRTTMIGGLSTMQPAQHGGSYLIGGYCAMVQVIWETRDPRTTATQVAGTLASVMSEVLNQASGGACWSEDPVTSLVDAMTASAMACAPRDSQGEPDFDGDQLLDACALMAGRLLTSLSDPDARALRLGEFQVAVENQVELQLARRSALS